MLQLIEFLDAHDGAFMVIITLIYVVATIAICIANLRSAKATRDQLEESKHQYEEEHRAFISYEFIYENRVWYGLRFTNHGKRVATNVQLQLDKDFIDSLIEQSAKEQLRRLEGKEFTLGIEQSYDIFFGGNKFRERPNEVPIQGKVLYKDRNGTYADSFYIDFSKYAPIFTVTTDGERIGAAARELNKSLKSIGNELKQVNGNLTRQQTTRVTLNKNTSPHSNTNRGGLFSRLHMLKMESRRR